MLVKKGLWVVVALIVFAKAETAEAHWFEPQSHWWTSGRLCVASRHPPARRWQALPPRSCVSARVQGVLLDAAGAPIVGKQEFAKPKDPVSKAFLTVVARLDENDLPSAD